MYDVTNKVFGVYKRVFVLVCLLLLGVFGVTLVGAQTETPWTRADTIPWYTDDTYPPVLLADEAGVVHAFAQQRIERQWSIVYNQWSLDTGWSVTVDVLVSPIGGPVRILGAHFDQNDVLHFLFTGGNEQLAHVYYTSVPAVAIANSQAWQVPKLVGDNAGPLLMGTLAINDEGQLWAVYTGETDGHGVYVTVSFDQGVSWSKPELFFLTLADNLFPERMQAMVDEQQRLHLVWAVVDDIGLGRAIYYSRLAEDGKTWGQTMILAKPSEGGYQARWPALTLYEDTLFLMYNNDVQEGINVPMQWMRRSADYGETWTEPQQYFDHIGEYGAARFAVDSTGQLHVVMGNRDARQTPDQHGLWHSRWQNETWTPLEPIIAGPKEPTFDPSQPSIVMSQGHILLATWWTDGVRNGVWYAYTDLGTPPLARRPLQRPTAVAVGEDGPVAVATSSVPVVMSFNDNAPGVLPSPADNLVVAVRWGVLAASLFLLVVVVGQRLYKR